MPVDRYKARPITPVDAVLWNGENLAEVQTVCPEAKRVSEGSSTLVIPSESGQSVEVYVGNVVMSNVGGIARYTKLDAEVFDGLYMPQ